MTDTVQNSKWYHSTWFIFVTLFFCAPVGLIVLWTNPAQEGFFASKKAKIIGSVIFSSLFLIAVFSNKEGGSGSSSNTAVEVDIPEQQKQFIAAVNTAAKEYNAAANELKKSAVRKKRIGMIRQALKGSRQIKDWKGIIKNMGTNSDGKAYIEIELLGDRDIEIKTWNNALSDIRSGTLIATNSALFQTISELNNGDEVIFSGVFIASSDDFIRAGALTERGAMVDPEFIARFTNIKTKVE